MEDWVKETRYYKHKTIVLDSLRSEIDAIARDVAMSLNARKVTRNDMNIDRKTYMKYARLKDKLEYDGAMTFFLVEAVYYYSFWMLSDTLIKELFGDLSNKEDSYFWELYGNDANGRKDAFREILLGSVGMASNLWAMSDKAICIDVHLALLQEDWETDLLQSFAVHFILQCDQFKQRGVVQEKKMQECLKIISNLSVDKATYYKKMANMFLNIKNL